MPESESGSGHGRQLGIRLSGREACKLGLAGAVLSARGDVFGGLAKPPDPAGKVRKSMNNKPHIVVVGAGAFGGWTALYLLRGGDLLWIAVFCGVSASERSRTQRPAGRSYHPWSCQTDR